MIRIALLEDEEDAKAAFEKNTESYAKNHNVEFVITHFDNAVSFLADYKPVYDIIFMDIRMPHMNGFEASKKLREKDGTAILIFLTNLAQYAIKGYEVGALDFIVKPITYHMLELKLHRAIGIIEKSSDIEVRLNIVNSLIRIKASEIKYIEVIRHKVIYHTVKGEYSTYSSMKKAEEELKGADFVKCNSCYLVNLRYVKSVKGYVADVDGAMLQISAPKRKEFVKALNDYLGRGGD